MLVFCAALLKDVIFKGRAGLIFTEEEGNSRGVYALDLSLDQVGPVVPHEV